MEINIIDIFRNVNFWSPFLAWMIAQLTKMLNAFLKTKKMDFRYIVSTGGMPSAHSAMVTGLATSIGVNCGFKSPIFALSMAFALLTMFDASTVRRAAGEQADHVEAKRQATTVARDRPGCRKRNPLKLPQITGEYFQRLRQKSSVVLPHCDIRDGDKTPDGARPVVLCFFPFDHFICEIDQRSYIDKVQCSATQPRGKRFAVYIKRHRRVRLGRYPIDKCRSSAV